MHISKVNIQGDSFMVIQEITRDLWDDDQLFHDVKFLIDVLTYCEVELLEHIFRKANSCTNWTTNRE